MSRAARRRRVRAGRVAVVAVTLGVAIAGCGVGTQSGAQRISTKDIPFGLAKPATATTTTVSGQPSPAFPVYFAVGTRLVGVWRTASSPLTLRAVLRTLVNGPEPNEAAFGVRSAIPPDTRVLLADVNGPVATVDLDVAFLAAGPTIQVTALAQLVYTASAFDGVKAVRFLVEGQKVDVPLGDGTLASGVVTRADYAAFAP